MKIYRIINRNKSELGFSFDVGLNADHPVYPGHFPNRAITPGVLLVSMVKDLVEEVKEVELELVEARNIKFLQPMHPDENEVYTVHFTVEQEENKYQVKATASVGEVAYFKLSATFESIS